MSKLLDVKDVSSLLKLSEPTVRKLIREQKLPEPMRVGGSLRWLESDLNDYLANLRKPSVDAA